MQSIWKLSWILESRVCRSKVLWTLGARRVGARGLLLALLSEVNKPQRVGTSFSFCKFKESGSKNIKQLRVMLLWCSVESSRKVFMLQASDSPQTQSEPNVRNNYNTFPSVGKTYVSNKYRILEGTTSIKVLPALGRPQS